VGPPVKLWPRLIFFTFPITKIEASWNNAHDSNTIIIIIIIIQVALRTRERRN
jgi:hypothetical protein